MTGFYGPSVFLRTLIVLGLSRHFPDPRGATRRFRFGRRTAIGCLSWVITTFQKRTSHIAFPTTPRFTNGLAGIDIKAS